MTQAIHCRRSRALKVIGHRSISKVSNDELPDPLLDEQNLESHRTSFNEGAFS